MASRKRLQLTDLILRKAKHSGKGRTTVLSDGDGLRLLVHDNGNKVWQFRTKKAGKETTIQFASYPAVSLSKARVEAASFREMIRLGKDPVTERYAERAKKQSAVGNTFKAVAEGLFEVKKKNVSPSYYKKICGAVSANLFPRIGQLPIQEVTAPILRNALKPLEARGSLDMLAFVRRCAGEIFNFAKATGSFTGDNPAEVLKKNIFANHSREHMAALKWEDMPGFLHRLDGMKGEFATVVALRLLMLTACRPGEIRGARWEEFDLEKALWTIPALRMKGKVQHIVPLAKQVVQLLKELYLLTGEGEYLFPAQRGAKAATLSDMALLKAARRPSIDKRITAHGFRATFRTHAEESGLWLFDVMEAALAHKKTNAVVGAYARATHLEARIKLAQWYADELDQVKGNSSTEKIESKL